MCVCVCMCVCLCVCEVALFFCSLLTGFLVKSSCRPKHFLPKAIF